jgi:hypothetical protein
VSEDDLMGIWHTPSAPAPEAKPKPVIPPRPAVTRRPVTPTPQPDRGTPVLNPRIGDRVTITFGGRDRTAIVRYLSDGKVVVDLDPVPMTGPVGGYQGIRVEPHKITRILPKR